MKTDALARVRELEAADEADMIAGLGSVPEKLNYPIAILVMTTISADASGQLNSFL